MTTACRWVVIVVKRSNNSTQMHHSAKHSKYMKYLMRVAPDIKGSWSPTFRYSRLLLLSAIVSVMRRSTYRIDDCSSNIAQAL
jgi:hypothetical protein